jgi:uncharacterized protein
MKTLKWLSTYLLIEPFYWIYWCFRQPVRFAQEVESRDYSKRVVPMVRLILPLFLIILVPDLILFHQAMPVLSLYILFSIALCVIWGIVENMATGIISGIFLGLLLSLFWLIGPGVGLGIEASIGMGIASSLKRDFAGFRTRRLLGKIIVSVWMGFWGMVFYPIGYILRSIFGAIPLGIVFLPCIFLVSGFADGNITDTIIIGTVIGAANGWFLRKTFRGNAGRASFRRASLRIILTGAILGAILGIGVHQVGMNLIIRPVKANIANMANSYNDSNSISEFDSDSTATAQVSNPSVPKSTPPLHKPAPSNVSVPLSLAYLVAFILIICILSGLLGGIVGLRNGIRSGLKSDLVNDVLWDVGACSVLWGFLSGFIGGQFWGLVGGIILGLFGCLFYNAAYALGHYKIPIYSFTMLSMLKVAYFDSEKVPSSVFDKLHFSWLYASEATLCLSLPGLQKALLIAFEEDSNRALEEIRFLIAERPHQLDAAQTVLREYALQMVNSAKTLRDIAELAGPFERFCSEWRKIIDPVFTALSRACKDAHDYQIAVSWQVRIDALKSILKEIPKIDVISLDEHTKPSLTQVISRWRSVAQNELNKLEQDRPKNNQINNPYVPGAVLQLGTTLFVGRQDLAMQLELALALGRHRPTFFLNGERRIGKSSTLRQLPNLLSKRYLPIYYDLQKPGFLSSTTAFLNTVATEIYKQMAEKNIHIEKIEYVDLQNAARQNEAASYAVFDAWLDGVEEKMEFEKKTLFLTFDEFEKLEDAGKANYLDPKLLLNWFRSTIQNRSRVALLFSGLHTLGEMSLETGISWVGYFVNVQTVKASFLHRDEAHQLITRPVPDFLGSQIFDENIVDEIIRITGCHPFLVQAICSGLIENLNVNKRFKAEKQDVVDAVKLVFERWDSYFRDLSERTDVDQLNCLIALHTLGEGNHLQIMQQSGLENGTVRGALQRLYQRDLILLEDERYRIAAPIFRAWVERNN